MAAHTNPPVDDLAPTPVEELLPDVINEENKKDDDEGDGEEGGDGKKGGGGGKKPAVAVSPAGAEKDLNEYDSESLIEKLKMLVWAPFSAMVPGASSFEAETDLKRKLFLGQIGLITNQIDPHDIADPELINRLEARNQERQAAYKAEILAASGAAAGLAAGLSGETTPQETKKEQRKDQRQKQQQAMQPKEVSFDTASETRDDNKSERKAEVKTGEVFKQETETAGYDDSGSDIDKKQGDFARKEPEAKSGMDIDDVLDIIDNNRKDSFDDVPSGVNMLDTVATISALFNATAEKTEYTMPEHKIDLKFADPAPKMEMGGSGMGRM